MCLRSFAGPELASFSHPPARSLETLVCKRTARDVMMGIRYFRCKASVRGNVAIHGASLVGSEARLKKKGLQLHWCHAVKCASQKPAFACIGLTWTSQMEVVASKLAQARVRQSGDQLQLLTVRLCVSSNTAVQCHSLLCPRDQIRTVLSPLQLARDAPVRQSSGGCDWKLPTRRLSSTGSLCVSRKPCSCSCLPFSSVHLLYLISARSRLRSYTQAIAEWTAYHGSDQQSLASPSVSSLSALTVYSQFFRAYLMDTKQRSKHGHCDPAAPEVVPIPTWPEYAAKLSH